MALNHPPNTLESSDSTSYCHYGYQTLLKLFPTLESQANGVIKGEGVECVHKMRVSSRRIRAAMPLFKKCFPRKKFRKWLKHVKHITRTLGEARDLDVQIIFIKEYLKTKTAFNNQNNVKLLLEDLTKRRANVQATVSGELNKIDCSGVLEDITSYCTRMLKEIVNQPFSPQVVLQEAYWHITAKIDDFLAMEFCVHKEDDALNHHKMRIRAKWLRYNMEVFSPFYPKKLLKEIKLIKEFQDILGEMHDCDVWIECVPKLEQQNVLKQSPEDKTLLGFLEFVKQKRKTLYTNFVSLWDQKKKENAFEQIRKIIGNSLVNSENAIKQALLNPQEKIGVLSDIHSNLQALQAVIADAEQQGINIFLNAGDCTGFGAFPNEVIHLLNTKKILSVIGNVDLEVLEKTKKGKNLRKLALNFTRKELAKPCKEYLKNLPREVTLEVGDKKILLVHGSPRANDEHIYKDTPSEKLDALGKIAKADIVIVGHSHQQFSRESNNVSFINSGSVGRPYDGNPKAAYAIVVFNPLSVTFKRVDYDISAAASALRHKKLPESFAQMLLEGLSFEAIEKQDKVRKRKMQANCPEITEASKRLAEKYLENTSHPIQVRRIAMKVFDDLANLHNLGKRERCWLECAAFLHDIGLSLGSKSHNKKSLELILNDREVPFSSEDKRVVGSIARYHRNGLPKESHYNLSCLSKETKLKIKKLASILRLSDALDFTHQSIVEQVAANEGAKKINIECMVNANPMMEIQKVDQKKDLLEEVFGRKLVLIWKKK